MCITTGTICVTKRVIASRMTTMVKTVSTESGSAFPRILHLRKRRRMGWPMSDTTKATNT